MPINILFYCLNLSVVFKNHFLCIETTVVDENWLEEDYKLQHLFCGALYNQRKFQKCAVLLRWVTFSVIKTQPSFITVAFQLLQGILKLYHWPPIWLVWNQLYDNWQFLFLFAKQTNPNQSNRRSTVVYPDYWHKLLYVSVMLFHFPCKYKQTHF